MCVENMCEIVCSDPVDRLVPAEISNFESPVGRIPSLECGFPMTRHFGTAVEN